MFIDGEDQGYQDDPNWWYKSFRIAKLDEDYPAHYFTVAGVPDDVVKAYVENVAKYYHQITGNILETIIEYGSAGGWFSKEFDDIGYKIDTCDGSINARCDERCDFRQVFFANPPSTKNYDIALCTEVAEHLEPPFAAILVHNIICEADLIWWSSAEPGGNKPHLHHPNEQPLQYWINIFEFYGYGCYMLPDEVFNACAGRGRCLFYNKETHKL
jgi:hypothetical protein